MDWFRLYHGTISDPKWPIIARKSGTNIGTVVSVWAALLEYASQAETRGSVAGFDPEAIDALYGYDDGTTLAVVTAMEEKGVLSGSEIVAWAKRQPMREDGSAERAKEWRERKKAEANAPRTQPNAAERTPNAKEHREDKRREEKNKNTNTQGLAGNNNRARERDGPQGSVPDACSEPGIEFQELRALYDEHRPEAPLTGFAEYKQLRASRRWPGIARICQAVDAHREADPDGWRDYCPGLKRFLSEQWWDRNPEAKARASPRGVESPLRQNIETARNLLAKRQRGRQHAP